MANFDGTWRYKKPWNHQQIKALWMEHYAIRIESNAMDIFLWMMLKVFKDLEQSIFESLCWWCQHTQPKLEGLSTTYSANVSKT